MSERNLSHGPRGGRGSTREGPAAASGPQRTRIASPTWREGGPRSDAQRFEGKPLLPGALEPGQIVDRYTVEEKIGEGGMADVYRVRHTALSSLHALKVLAYPSPGLRNRLLQEGTIQAGLKHRNVVAVTDILDVQGSPGLLMPFVDGPSLQRWLEKNRPSPDQAMSIFWGALQGIAEAHRLGIIHRDLKPENILLATEDGQTVPKIMDFGLAKILNEERGVTKTGQMMGTPAYMAPEQIQDAKSADHRSDIYALGCILYELLAGRPAFGGPDIQAIFYAALTQDYVPLRTQIPDLPERYYEAVRGCMVLDRSRRIESCEALIRLLNDEAPGRREPTAPSDRRGQIEELERLLLQRARARGGCSDELTRKIDGLVNRLRIGGRLSRGDRVVGVTLVKPIGAGAFGAVWMGVEGGTGRLQAVKIFHLDKLGDGLMLWRFRRGIRAMEALAQRSDAPEGLVRVGAVSEDTLAFSMDYLSERSLAEIADRGWSLQKKVQAFIRICRAAAFAHANGVVHRDIKPANVVIDDRDEPVLTDFDIADVGFATRLSVGGGLGSPVFAAPEQLAEASSADARSDVYSLGRLLHFLLLESAPGYPAGADPELAELARYPRALVAIVRRATQRDPALRYERVDEMIWDLERYDAPRADAVARLQSARRWALRNASLLLVVGALIGTSGALALRQSQQTEQSDRYAHQLEGLLDEVIALRAEADAMTEQEATLDADAAELEAEQADAMARLEAGAPAQVQSTLRERLDDVAAELDEIRSQQAALRAGAERAAADLTARYAAIERAHRETAHASADLPAQRGPGGRR